MTRGSSGLTAPPASGGGPTADLSGLRAAPCDPLMLAVRLDGRPLRGLTGRVDWRIGGRISELLGAGEMPADDPLMLPAPDFLPTPRLVLWRIGAATPGDLARLARELGAERPGLCAADFGFTSAEVQTAFAGRAVIYDADPEPR